MAENTGDRLVREFRERFEGPMKELFAWVEANGGPNNPNTVGLAFGLRIPNSEGRLVVNGTIVCGSGEIFGDLVGAALNLTGPPEFGITSLLLFKKMLDDGKITLSDVGAKMVMGIGSDGKEGVVSNWFSESNEEGPLPSGGNLGGENFN